LRQEKEVVEQEKVCSSDAKIKRLYSLSAQSIRNSFIDMVAVSLLFNLFIYLFSRESVV